MDQNIPSPQSERDEPAAETPYHPRAVRFSRWILAPYLVVLGLIVFLPAREAGRITGIVGWAADILASFGASREASAAVLEFLANIALFVPFGVLVAIAFPTLSWWIVLAAGCLASVGIELVQIGIPSRFPTISDVIANTAGTALGLLLMAWWVRARHPLGFDRSPT